MKSSVIIGGGCIMKIKEIIILCLIVCFIFSISSVSAVDVDSDDTNNTALTTADSDVVKKSNDLSTISLPENTTLLGDGEGSFSDLSGHLNGDYTLDKDYKYSSSDTAYISGITIDQSITIDGKGHSIDGDNQARIFNIAEGASVTLKNIKLINGKTTDNGGAIYSQGTISIENCTFINNNAKDGGAIYLHNLPGLLTKLNFTDNHATHDGGAIYYHPDAAVGDEDGLTNSVFIGNTAGDEGGALYLYGNNGNMRNVNFTRNIAANDGGAIMIIGANWRVYDSTFNNNNATARRGGAIYLENSKGSTVSNSKFYNNTAGTNGGAIDWHNGAENGRVINTIFIDNVAKRSGGAIYWYGHNGTILSSNFTDNKALGSTYAVNPDGENVTGGDGGAVLWTGDLGTVDDCIFKFNTADKRGGAVFLRGTGVATCMDTSFTNSKFINNTAGTNGGAIVWNKCAQNGIIDNTVFIDNTAKRSGGAVFWYGYNGTIRNSNFTHNYALGVNNATSVMGEVTYGGDGGAVIWTGSLGIVDNCNFNENEAAKRGGAVFLQGTSEDNCTNTTFKNSNFTSNVAGTNGGAIDWNKGARNGIVYNVTFIDNTAKRSGGAIFWNGHNGTISWAKFYNNRALGINNATSVMGDVTYGGDGGAVIWSGALGTVYFSNFVNNTAAKRGGAVFLQGTTDEDCDNTTFKNSYFANNIAGTNGGAIDWFAGAHHGIVDNVTFINNTAKRSGGAIFWHGNDGVVKNSKFTNNRATGEYLQYDMDLKFDDVIIVNNDTLPVSGGANKLYVLNYTSENGREFKSYVYDDEKWILLDETTVNVTTISPKDWAIDQFFGGDGGTILWSGDIGLVYNCTFVESNSARRGGGAYMTGSDYVTYELCTFTNCTSGTNGGGVDWLAGANYGKIYNCVFNNTRAARSAGAIYYDGWYGEMINITVIGTQSYGGSLKTSRDERVQYAGWDSSHWDTNTTGGDAGAIMFTGSHEYVYNVTFLNCYSVGRGGAIFLQGAHNVQITHGMIINPIVMIVM